MTTLITGGTGFIGAEVVRMLLDTVEQPPVVFHVSSNMQRLDARNGAGHHVTPRSRSWMTS